MQLANRVRRNGLPLLWAAAICLGTCAVPAAARTTPVSSAVVSLTVEPAPVVLDRPLAEQRLLVTGTRRDGVRLDLSHLVRLRVDRPGVVRITAAQQVASVRDGESRVTVLLPARPGQAALRTEVPVSVRNAGPRYPWDFAIQISPILARAGCSGTSCHGSQHGRGGLRLSAFGHDPERDYTALVRADGGRRVNRQQPGASLLLLKPTLAMPHAGGQRFGPTSDAYRTLASWIADGAPRGSGRATVSRIEVFPRERLLTLPQQRQPLLVMAQFSDGTREDVTDLAVCESRNEDAVVLDGPVARAAGLGETTLLARFGGRTATARFGATPRPRGGAFPTYHPSHIVDREVFGRLKRLNLPPAAPAPDAEWLRRVMLDLVGRIPTVAELEGFLADNDAQKRERQVDALLDGPEYARHWRDNLNALLMGRTAFPVPPEWGSLLETWLREDRGWDSITRELLLARTSPDTKAPLAAAALRFLDSRFAQGDTGLDTVTRDVSRIFFGVDVQCARCHAHPEVAQWQQDVYWGISAFFGRTYRIQVATKFYLAERALGEVEYFGSDQAQRVARPVFLTGDRPEEPPMPAAGTAGAMGGAAGTSPPDPPELYAIQPETAKEKTRVPRPRYSRRERFVQLAVGPNPYFRRALVNRVWAMLMGRGLVEPVDQMHSGNPATHPELLEALSVDFADHGFRLKHLLRTIVTSRAYGLTSRWEQGVPPAPELYAVAAVRPQNLWQLAGSTLVALGYWDQTVQKLRAEAARSRTAGGSEAADRPRSGPNLPGGEPRPAGGIEAAGSPTAGLSAARAAFEAAFAGEQDELRKRLDTGTDLFLPGVSQALYLSNSPAFTNLVNKGGVADRLAQTADDREAVGLAYLTVLSRPPDPDELSQFVAFLGARRDRRPAGLRQMLWALLASTEFRFIH